MADDGAGDGAPKAPVKINKRCPICAKPASDDYKPFCSKRCADIDLGKWFSDAYTIPGQAGDEEADTQQTPRGDAPERD